MTNIIRINLTHAKYHVYAQNGILLSRVNFIEEKLKYGDPICVSKNGRYMVFHRRMIFLRQLEAMREEMGLGIQQHFDL